MPENEAAKKPGSGIVFRGLAYLIDCVCAFVIFAIAQLLIFLPARNAIGISDQWFRSGINTEVYTLLTISAPVWLYFSLMESSRWQATIGKRLLGLCVIDAASSSKVSFGQAALRTVIKLAPWELAHIGNNLPDPIWYAEDPSFRIAFVFSGLLMAGYMAWISLSGRRRGVHDLVTGTLVICTHPPVLGDSPEQAIDS